MPIRKIIQSQLSGGSEANEALLHSSAIYAHSLNDEIINVIQDLRDTFWAYPFCVGLSAPQIGSSYAISIVNPTRESSKQDLIIINPKIITLSGKKDRKRESCMSVWGMLGEVERRDKLLLEYRDINFNPQKTSFSGFLSRVVQHELDHLNGILYTDRLYKDTVLEHADFFDNFSLIDS